MANSVNKRINIWINGKEVENNIKSVRAAIRKLVNEQAKMTIGSDEYNAHAKKIKELKGIYSEHLQTLKATSTELEKMTNKSENFLQRISNILHLGFGVAVVKKMKDFMSEYVEAFLSLDDALAAVRKTTGMTTDEVHHLQEELQKVDTRTATEELLKIAEQGGRLGIAKEQIEDFTKAVDVANVALGDSFSGGAEEIATVLGKIRMAYDETRNADIAESFNRIGSAINEIGANSAASEQNVAEFAKRVGSMSGLLKPTIQEALALGGAFEEAGIDAEVASRSYAIILQSLTKHIDDLAKMTGKKKEEISNMFNADPTAFVLEFSKWLKTKDSAIEYSETLAKLGMNADGVSRVLSAMADKGERFTEIIKISEDAFSEAASLGAEFATVNNNSAAQLEKAKNEVKDATAELGKSLIPVFTIITQGTAKATKALGAVFNTVIKNKDVILSFATAWVTYLAIKNRVVIAEKAHLVVQKASALAMKVQNSIMAISITATNLYALAQAKLTRNTVAATQASKALKAAQASTPWGAIVLALTALADVFVRLSSSAREARKEMVEFEQRTDKEKRAAKSLFDELENLNKGTKEYKDKQQEILNLYPELLKDQVDEEGNLKNLKDAYDSVCQSIEMKTALQMKSEDIDDAYAKYIKKTNKAFQDFSVTNQETIKQMLEEGKGIEEIAEKLSIKQYVPGDAEIDPRYKKLWKIVNQYEKLKEKLEDIDAAFSPYIQKPKKVTKTESEEPECTGNPDTCPCSKCEQARKKKKAAEQLYKDRLNKEDKYQKYLAALREEAYNSKLNEWLKAKHKIEKKWNEVIDEGKTLGKSKEELAELEREKGDAIIQAGNEYLKKYSEFLNKFAEESKKLSNDGLHAEHNQLINDILGSQSEWNAKILEIQNNISILESILNDISPEDSEFSEFSETLTNLINAQNEAIRQKGEETANIINQYVQKSTDFVENETENLTKSQQSEYQKQIKAIDARYDAEINKAKSAIATIELLKGGDNDEDLQKLIDDLYKLIAKLEFLRDENKSNAAGQRFRSVFVDLKKVMEMSPDEFKENWVDALDTTADAMREMFSAASDIYNSILQIQGNKEEAELQKYMDIQDQKSETLKKQYEDGIISEKSYNEQLEKLREEKEKKEKEYRHNEFERNKKASVIQATIDGALAIMKIFAQNGLVIGPALAEIQAAATAMQIAAITSQANPYARGGWVEREQLILAGEDGREWIASNRLLKDKKTKPVIEALDKYQKGDVSALKILQVPVPDTEKLSNSAKSISITFAANNSTVLNNNYRNDIENKILNEVINVSKYLKDPRNRQAYITRKMQLEFEDQENEIKNYARL